MTRSNFYDSNFELLVTFPTSGDRAYVINDKLDRANKRIEKYHNGEISHRTLYYDLVRFGDEYNISRDSEHNTKITRPFDFYWLRGVGAYIISQEFRGTAGPEVYGLGLYYPNYVEW
jgi:hypothetical protein